MDNPLIWYECSWYPEDERPLSNVACNTSRAPFCGCLRMVAVLPSGRCCHKVHKPSLSVSTLDPWHRVGQINAHLLLASSFQIQQEACWTGSSLLWAAGSEQSPLQPISTGNNSACHPFSLHSWTKAWYIWRPFSDGLLQTLPPNSKIPWLWVNHSTISGWKVVCPPPPETCSLVSTSTLIFLLMELSILSLSQWCFTWGQYVRWVSKH